MDIQLLSKTDWKKHEDRKDEKRIDNDDCEAHISDGSQLNDLKPDHVIELEQIRDRDSSKQGRRVEKDMLKILGAQIDVVTRQLELMTSQTVDGDKVLGVVQEWQALAKVLDRLLFFIVIVVLVISFIWLVALL